jgi:hypothetical protein
VHEVVELVDEYEDVHGWDGTRVIGSTAARRPANPVDSAALPGVRSGTARGSALRPQA